MMKASQTIRVLIVEDHALIVAGIGRLLDDTAMFEVVGHAQDGLEVYRLCQECAPDLVLMDIGLPGMDGIDVIRQLKRRWPALRIVMLTAAEEEHVARAAFAAGAQGYVLKKSSQQVLLAAMQAVALDRRFVDPALNEALAVDESAAGEQPVLTLRERQVLKLVAEGCRNRDVAEHLSISLKTVETHRLNLMRKLNAHNTADLVHWARRIGLH